MLSRFLCVCVQVACPTRGASAGGILALWRVLRVTFTVMWWHVVLYSAQGINNTLLVGVFTSFWEGDIASVFLRAQQLNSTLNFLNIGRCGIILDSRYSGDICNDVFEWTCLMLVCYVHVLWHSGSFTELLNLTLLGSSPSRLMQSTCHSAVTVLQGCLGFYEVLVF